MGERKKRMMEAGAETKGKLKEAEAKTSIIKRIGRFLGTLAGIGTGWTLLRELAGLKGRRKLSGIREQLEHNLLAEEGLQKGSFAEVLACWGLKEKDLPNALASLRREAVFGGLLCLFACLAVPFAWQVQDALPDFRFMRFFALPAAGSAALAGFLMLLAALWRHAVLKKRRFVPFLAWLLRRRC